MLLITGTLIAGLAVIAVALEPLARRSRSAGSQRGCLRTPRGRHAISNGSPLVDRGPFLIGNSRATSSSLS